MTYSTTNASATGAPTGRQFRIHPLLRLAATLAALALAASLAWPGATLSGSDSTWLGLIAPYAPGSQIGNGFVLSSPRYGQFHDVIFVARRQSADPSEMGNYVEVHFVERNEFMDPWKEKSARFSAYFECPKVGSTPEEIEQVLKLLSAAVRVNDPPSSNAAPVKAESIPLGVDRSSSTWARALERLTGARGMAFGAALAASLLLASGLPGGPLWASLLCGLLALGLRAASVENPLSSAAEIGVVLDTHMPLHWIFGTAAAPYRLQPAYPALLHAAQRFGQGASVVRLPSLVASALAVFLISGAAWLLRRRASLLAVFAGFLVATAPGSILRARELSDVGLSSLLAAALAVALVSASQKPGLATRALVGVATALTLYASVLGAFVVVGCALPLAFAKKLDRKLARALALGIACGAPPLVQGLLRIEREARSNPGVLALADVVLHPHLALAAGRAAVAASVSGIGWPLLALFVLCALLAALRRDLAALVPLSGTLIGFVGLAVMTPVAHLGPEHVVVLAPLAALVVALCPIAAPAGWQRIAAVAALGGVAAAFTAPGLSTTTATYLPGAANSDLLVEAARWLVHRPMRMGLIDPNAATPLAYYTAVEAGTPIDRWRLRRDGDLVTVTGLHVELLVLTPSPDLSRDVDLQAHKHLSEAASATGLLVLSNNGLRLPIINHRLEECRPVYQGLAGRMVYCPGARPS